MMLWKDDEAELRKETEILMMREICERSVHLWKEGRKKTEWKKKLVIDKGEDMEC